MKKRMLPLLFLFVCLLMISPLQTSFAATKYPSGDVTIIIPAAAGGGNDLLVRAMVPGMQKIMNVKVFPDNKPAAKGAVAANEIMKGQPDGQKLYFNSQTLLLMPYGGMPDVKLENFEPVAQVAEDTGVLIVKADAPYKNLTDFVQAAKAKKLIAAHNGTGALWHLAEVVLSKAIGTPFQYIAYTNGGAQMLNALVAGEVDFCVLDPAETKSMIDSGKVKVLAVLNDKRHSVVPNVPTCKEQGVNVVFPVWRGLFTTAGTSEEILNNLDRIVKATTQSSEFVSFATTNGLPIKFRNHKEFKTFVYQEKERYAKLMADINN